MGGITPACAGSTIYGWNCDIYIEDHPRLRGEYSGDSTAVAPLEGSPPLARGVLICKLIVVTISGITPACAGSTKYRTELIKFVQDHPRLRGEYTGLLMVGCSRIGSPPLTRGVLFWFPPDFSTLRITPAYAGSTPRNFQGLSEVRDHPCLRGEYLLKCRLT